MYKLQRNGSVVIRGENKSNRVNFQDLYQCKRFSLIIHQIRKPKPEEDGQRWEAIYSKCARDLIFANPYLTLLKEIVIKSDM